MSSARHGDAAAKRLGYRDFQRKRGRDLHLARQSRINRKHHFWTYFNSLSRRGALADRIQAQGLDPVGIGNLINKLPTLDNLLKVGGKAYKVRRSNL